MKKQLLSLLGFMLLASGIYSQAIFSEDFDNVGGPTSGGPGTYTFPAGWFLRNVDNRTPATNVAYVNDAWERREDFANNVLDSCVFSTSWYSPAGASNDFMWTPLINVPANAKLSWNALTYDAAYRDGYEVRIMTVAPTGGTGVIGNQITNSTVLFSITAENTTWTARNVSLSAYAGQGVYIGFRTTSTDKFLLLIDDINVFACNYPVATTSSCTAGSASVTPVFGATSSYTWAPSGGNASVANNLAPGNYTVTITDPIGCAVTVTTAIVTLPAPSVSITGAPAICQGAAATLTASGADTYVWNTSATTATLSESPTSNTGYTVTGTAVNGCTNTAVITVTVNNLPTVTASATNSVICNGESTTLTGGAATTYTWSGTVTDGVAFTPTATADYTVTGTDGNGCENTAVTSVTVNTLPGVTASSTNSVICDGATITLTGGAATTYTWSGTVTDGVAFTPTATADYTVTGTDGNGCENTAVTSVTVNTLPAVTASATNSVICNGESTTLTGGGAATYTWSGTVTDGVAFTPTATADYTVTGTDGNGCENTAVTSVTVNTLPGVTASSTNSVICDGATITLTGGAATTYTWSGTVTDGVAFTPTATADYTVTGTDGNGCENTAVTSVTVNPLPSLSVSTSNTLICTGEFADLTLSGATSFSVDGVSSGTLVSVSPSVTTTYTITGTDANGCDNSVTFTQDVSLCTGIAHLKTNAAQLSLYPNPNNGSFTIKSVKEENVVITNEVGQVIKEMKLVAANNYSVEIAGLSSGVYFVVTPTFKGKVIVTQ